MTKEKSLIIGEREAAVLILTLNHAEKGNSLHPELVRQLSDYLTQAASDESLNAVILTGSGKTFCAGLDLTLLMNLRGEEKSAYLSSVTKLFDQIWMLPQPVIAAINGAAIAGGFDLAAFCDIRLAAHQAIFGQAEINVGLTQIIHPLYKTIGLARAKELAMTGENISATEAYRIGLVNHVYERDELLIKARDMAAVLASKPRFALLETKRLTRELIDLDTRTALAEIHKSLHLCFDSPEHKSRVAEVYAKLTKSKPS
jgi:enoyl-CoA hydratase/carnithine racemase